MFKRVLICGSVALILVSCATEDAKEVGENEKTINDSLSKVSQKRKVDSLKKINPLLILPPDSTYTGEYVDKYPSGIILYRGFFRFGQRHGQWVSFYQNGMPWSEQSYNKGLREGANIVYYENSKIRYKGYYRNDKRDSVWTFYDSLGKVMRTIVYKEDKELSSK
jgi:antitoxin component YwqK of YwqJK toxin-antitoxin module